jgi:hypothetical protein
MATNRTPEDLGPSKLDRSPWTEVAEDGEFPRGLPCPHCGHALDWPEYDEVPDPKTADAMRRADGRKRKIKLAHASFTLLAEYKCGSCKGKMHGLARMRYRDWEYEPPAGDRRGTVAESRIVWLEPPPPLVALPAEVPDLVRAVTLEAFALLLHPSSCANRIRYAIELLADYFKVPRSRRTKIKNPHAGGKQVRMRRLPLHARVDELAKHRAMRTGQAELLEAAKWLGNDGSHGEIGIQQALDLIDIFVLALNRIFGTHEAQIERKARDINRRKRRRK